MTYRYLHHLKCQWLVLLGLTLSAGLGAQCSAVPAFSRTLPTSSVACDRFAAVSLDSLPDGTLLCYRTAAADGTLINQSLAADLRAALVAGGGIPAATSACGGEVEICVTDTAEPANGCGARRRVLRRFSARNTAAGAATTAVTYEREILFVRPELADLSGIEEAIFVVADDGQGVPVNPAPRPADYPAYALGPQTSHLTPDGCSLSVTYQDEARRNGCGNNFRFLRVFRVNDLCTGGSALFTQVVKVGDQRERQIVPPPIVDYPITFNTTENCGARIDTRATGITVNELCSGGNGLYAYVYLNGRFESTPRGPYRVDADFGTGATTDPIPAGSHVIRYVSQDSYGTRTTLDIDVIVRDATPPVARCRASLTAILREDGTRRIASQLYDGGSTDACGGVRIRAARADEDGNPTEAFTEEMTFTCADVGARDVVVEVTDDGGGNRDRCFLTVIVEDNTRPVCQAPADLTLDCRTFADQFPADLTAIFFANPDSMSAQLDNVFGAAAGADNCGRSSTHQTLSGDLSNCGTGRFVREFTVVDAGGFTGAEVCRQLIDVRPYIAYSLLLPADQRYTCTELPTPEDLVAGDTGCDLLTVTTQVDTLADNGVDCYRLRLRHEVVNWCEYDGVSAGLTIPRDADGNGREGDRLGVHILARNANDLTDDVAQLDRDYRVGNGNELGLLVSNYATSGLRGRFRYEQFVSLTDDTPPVTTIPADQSGPAFTDNCLGGVVFSFTATDDCVTPATTVSVDLNGGDRDGNGVLTAADFTEERLVPQSQFRQTAAGQTEVRIRNLPIGEHLARLRVTDDCGNLEERYALLTIVDSREPTPVCRTVRTVSLATDPDFGGAAAIYAADFITGPPASCTETDFNFAVFRETEAAEVGFVPGQDRTSLHFTCSDLGEQLLRVYAFAAGTGRNDFCRVVVNVTDENDVCTGRRGSIGGIVVTEDGQPLKDLETYLTPTDGSLQRTTRTADNGTYAFTALLENQGYAVQPYRNDEANNGVETFDISQLYRLITDQNFSDFTPYQLIAADANNNGTITVVDLLAVRSVVLGITTTFENNNSWRFIPADYVFPDPTNPWAERFPDDLRIDELTGHVEGDFIAIKVGDLNNTARPNGRSGLIADPTGGRSPLTLAWKENGANVWELLLAQSSDVTALQFALQLSQNTTVLSEEGVTQGYFRDRNYVLRVVALPQQQRILRIRLPEGASLPTLAHLPAFPALAYRADETVAGLSIEQPDDPWVPVSISVSPNPATSVTTLRFGSAAAETVNISLLTTAGREVHRQQYAVAAGINEVDLNLSALRLTPGLYYVRLQQVSSAKVIPVVIR